MKTSIAKMSITRGVIDTTRLDNDSIANGVSIPIVPTFTNSREFDCIYNILKGSVTEKKKGVKNLDLVIIAKQGHNIYDYDHEYDYYFGSYISTEKGKEYLIIPTELDEDEGNMIHNIIWKRRNIRKTLHNRVADKIRERLTNENLVLFVDGFEENQYRAVFTRITGGYGITVLVKDINQPDYEIELMQLGDPA